MNRASDPDGVEARHEAAESVPAATNALADAGHDEAVVQPHDPDVESGPIAEAEAAAAEVSSESSPHGRPGRRFNWHSPFFVGILATLGVALTYFGLTLLVKSAHVFILIGLGLFLAVGMEPAVSWLVRHHFRRVLAVATVLAVIVGAVGGFLAIAVPVLIHQANRFIENSPQLLSEINDRNSLIGKLNSEFPVVKHVATLISGTGGNALTGGLLSGAEEVFGAVADTLIVFVLTAYFLANMPQVRALIYRLFPRHRRPRAILIGDEIMAKVGSYVLGNLLVSLVAGVLTFVWLLIFEVPYALLLAIMVAILDLVPVVGSLVAGIAVVLVTLSVSIPLASATAAFFIAYRLAEDYLLIPRVIGRAVDVPALVTVVAVLVGGALLGIIGALVAIPVSAALLLLAREVLFPRLDID